MTMDLRRLTAVFMWCTIIDGGLLLLGLLVSLWATNPIYDLQSQWFGLPRETVNAAMYMFLGAFKMLWLVFNAVPYIALLIVGRKSATN